jgi:Ca-activated chloride channel family protein
MHLTVETYWPLVLAAIIPVVWWVGQSTVVDLSSKHLRLSTILRTAIIALLILGLMQPTFFRYGSTISTIYLLDVSESVSSASIRNAIQWMRKTTDSGHREARYIAFASNSISFDSLDALTQVSVSNHAGRGGRDTIDQSETNIASALDGALHHFAPDHLKRLVLISDGNETSGDVAEVLPRLRQEHVPVFTLPLESWSDQDAWIETVRTPAKVTADEQFPIEVQIFSSSHTIGEVEIRTGNTVLERRTALLEKGLNRIAFETSIASSTGTVMLEAMVTIAGDARAENNVFRQPVVLSGRPRVLYVEGHPASARYLQSALAAEGFTVDVLDVASIPSRVEQLDNWDEIILSDVDPRTLSKSQMQSMATYVRDLGGGFVLAGGEHTYGEGGYSGTPVEALLPVTFESDGKRPTVSMIVVLDRSSSMAEQQKIQLAREATKAPIDFLQRTDHFGVLVFDFNYKWYVNPQTIVDDREAIIQSISMIGVGGDTNIYPALREAGIQMAKSGDEIKHIILLSDGHTRPDDFQGLTTRLANAGITVSTVAVGTDSDRRLMENIAAWGKGKAYYVQDPSNVPQIFIEDTVASRGQTLHEDAFRPIVRKTVDIFKGIDFSTSPLLHGYVSSRAKSTSEVLLEAFKNRPLLTRWQYGLGKSAAFMSDVKDRWAVDWLKWKGYPKFWSQLVRETMRRRDDDAFDFRVRREGKSAVLSIDAVEKDGSFLNDVRSEVRIIDPAQRVSVVEVPQIGPGSYEVRVALEQRGTYVFHASSEGLSGASGVLAYSYPDELHFYPADLVMLRTISTETGGIFRPKGPEIFDSGGETTLVANKLWPWFAVLGLGLYLLDVLLRRVRLFEGRLRG